MIIIPIVFRNEIAILDNVTRGPFQYKDAVLPVWATPRQRKDVPTVVFPLTWSCPYSERDKAAS